MKKLESIFQERINTGQDNLTLANQNSQFQSNQSFGRTKNTTQKSLKGDGTDNLEFLCFGDTIFLNYTQKIFSEDIKKQADAENPDILDGKSEDGVAEEELKDAKRDEKLTKVIADPEYIYRGMVFSDGILDRTLKVIPKDPARDTYNATCQFQRCLFRIEVFDKCIFHEQYQKQNIKLQEMRQRRQELQAQNDFEELSKFELDYQQQEAHFENLKQEMQKERNSNTGV